MLSLHPQDINNSPCYLPYRSLAASSISAAPPSLMSFNMGGAVQHPPTPQAERMDLDAPLSPRTASAPAVISRGHHDTPCSTRRSSPAPPTISPPADYNNLDPNLVAEALEVARDSVDGARDPIVSGILESALSQLWDRVMSSPEGYVMTTGEFAVFNFYQHRFLGNKVAVAARRRFWDNTHA